MKTIQAHLRCIPVFALCTLIGCSTVTTIHPFGQPIATDLSAELDGTWMGAGGNQIQIRCGADGRLTYALTEWKEDQGGFVLETGDGVLTAIGDRIFFNDVEDHEGEASTYSFILLHVMDGQLVVWLPDVDEFRSLLEREVLAGTIEEAEHSTNIVLTGSSEEIAKAVEGVDLAHLFEWSEPAFVLVRMSSQ